MPYYCRLDIVFYQGDSMKNGAKVTLRMPSEIREYIATMANLEHRSMGGQIVAILEGAVKEHKKQCEEPAQK
jgi:hypothetical protein